MVNCSRTASGTKKVLRRVALRADLWQLAPSQFLSPHVLRKTGASLAVAAGVSPHIAKEQLGHARIETTKRHYLHLPVVEPLRQISAVFE